MQLETKYAEKIISLLEDAQDVGLPHVVFELRPQEMELQPHHLSFLKSPVRLWITWTTRQGIITYQGTQNTQFTTGTPTSYWKKSNKQIY